MEIPYTVSTRPDTGLWNAKIGIWLFLASEVMLFGGLFSAYIFLRIDSPPGMWPHGLLNVPVGTMNTAILILSSVTVVLAWAALKMRQVSGLLVVHAGHDPVRRDFLDRQTRLRMAARSSSTSAFILNRTRSGSTNSISATNMPPRKVCHHASKLPGICTIPQP